MMANENQIPMLGPGEQVEAELVTNSDDVIMESIVQSADDKKQVVKDGTGDSNNDIIEMLEPKFVNGSAHEKIQDSKEKEASPELAETGVASPKENKEDSCTSPTSAAPSVPPGTVNELESQEKTEAISDDQEGSDPLEESGSFESPSDPDVTLLDPQKSEQECGDDDKERNVDTSSSNDLDEDVSEVPPTSDDKDSVLPTESDEKKVESDVLESEKSTTADGGKVEDDKDGAAKVVEDEVALLSDGDSRKEESGAQGSNESKDNKDEKKDSTGKNSKGGDDDITIISDDNVSKKKDDDVIVIDDDDDEPSVSSAPRPKHGRKKSSQAALCKCILCGEMVRLSTLGLHVNSIHSKLIVKGNARIECKVCEEFYSWSEFVDHAQIKHKWSIVKNSTTKAKQVKLRTDYEQMKVKCIWCKQETDVRHAPEHFQTVHKVDCKVIDKALGLPKPGGAVNAQNISLPTGITGALFVTCLECNKDLKFSEVLEHFSDGHKVGKPSTEENKSKSVTNAPQAPQKPPSHVNKVPVLPLKQKPPTSKAEQVITLFKGDVDHKLDSKNTKAGYSLVKLAHDGKDKVLSIPHSHPIAVHKVNTIAVKGPLDDIPALIQSVTDLLMTQRVPVSSIPGPSVPRVDGTTISQKSSATSGKMNAVNNNNATRASTLTSDTSQNAISALGSSQDKNVSDSSRTNSETADSVVKDKVGNNDKSETKNPECSESEKDSTKEGEGTPSSSKSPKKVSPSRGSMSRLLELQRESMGKGGEETEADSSGPGLRRSSRRAKLAAKQKIKSVVEKEFDDYRKQLDTPEYVPDDEDYDSDGNLKTKTKIVTDMGGKTSKQVPAKNVIYLVSSASTPVQTAVTNTARKIEQYVFRSGAAGKQILVPLSKSPAVSNTSAPQFSKGLPKSLRPNILQARTPSSSTTTKASSTSMPGVAGASSNPQTSRVATKVILPQKSPKQSSVASTANQLLTPQMAANSAPLLQSQLTLQSPQIYNQAGVSTGPVMINPVGSPQGSPRFIIQPQQPSLAFMQHTVLQPGLGGVGNVQVQLQPQTIPVQSPNMMVMQNRLQLVTTPQGQQILLVPSNNNISQPVVVNQVNQVNQVPQNRMIIGSVGAQSTVAARKVITQAPQPQNPTLNRGVHQQAPVVAPTSAPVPISKKKVATTSSKPRPSVDTTVIPQVPLETGKDSTITLEALKKEKAGFMCLNTEMSVITFQDKAPPKVVPAAPSKNVKPLEATKENIGLTKKTTEEDAGRVEEFLKIVTLGTARGSILPSDFPVIPSIMFECSRCGVGIPTYLLLQTHLADCFDSPPKEEQAFIIRLPFSLLHMYFVNGPEPGGVVSCKLCSAIIARASDRDLVPLQAHVREHQANQTALKGGSVTFGVLSLTKVCTLKCKLCGEVLIRLWQDTTPLGSHLQKHIKGNVEISCNRPPVVGLSNKPHPQHISKKAYTWVDYIVPPFTMENAPISERQKNLDRHVATAGVLHHESLLPRRKRRHQTEMEAPKLRSKSYTIYQSNLKPLIIETSTNDTVTSYDIRPGKTNLLQSIKSMPSPNKLKRSTLTASIPVKPKHKVLMAQSTGGDRRKTFRQGHYRSARLQEKREKYLKEMEEAAGDGSGSESPVNPSTPVKEPEGSRNGILPVTCSRAQKLEKSPQATLAKAHVEDQTTTALAPATVLLKKFAESQASGLSPSVFPSEESPKVLHKKIFIPGKKKRVNSPSLDVSKSNKELKDLPKPSDETEDTPSPPSWNENVGIEYVEPAMPPRTPSPVKPETPPPPISEGDISDYLKIIEGCDSTLKGNGDTTKIKRRPVPEIGDVSLSDYFGDSANTSILCEPLIIEQGQAPMYFTRSVSTGYRFKCAFAKCEAAVPNNTLVMLAHLSQHFRVRIAGDFSQNGSVTGHRRTCKSLPLTINQVAAHFTLSDKEEASLHGGEVQMAYVCQWRNCSRSKTFKKGLITHLYRHVTFHLISSAEHLAMKEKSKPLKLSSAQFVPHGSGTKLITESMQTSHSSKINKNQYPGLLGLLNQKQDLESHKIPCGNYGTGSPMSVLIDKLTMQVKSLESTLPSSTETNSDPKEQPGPSLQTAPLSRASVRKGKIPVQQLGPQESQVKELRDEPNPNESTTSEEAKPSSSKDEEKQSTTTDREEVHPALEQAGQGESSSEGNSKRKQPDDDEKEADEDESKQVPPKKARTEDSDLMGNEKESSNRMQPDDDEKEANEDKSNQSPPDKTRTEDSDLTGSEKESSKRMQPDDDGKEANEDESNQSPPDKARAEDGDVTGSGKESSKRTQPDDDDDDKEADEDRSNQSSSKKAKTEDSDLTGDGKESDTDLTPPPFLSPEEPCLGESSSNQKNVDTDVPMPDLDFVGSKDPELEQVVKGKSSCTSPELPPKLDFIGDA